MSTIDRNSHFEATFVAIAAVSPRTLFLRHGKAYQVCGEDQIEIGEVVVGRSDRRSEIDKGNLTDVFALDADVFYATNGKAYLTLVAANAASAGGTGAFQAGIAQVASGATEPTVMVLLNFA